MIERKGRPTALLVMEGFRDVLHIRNEHRYEMYDPQIEFADPLVPSELTFGVAERVRADGTILRGPDEKRVEALAGKLNIPNRAAVQNDRFAITSQAASCSSHPKASTQRSRRSGRFLHPVPRCIPRQVEQQQRRQGYRFARLLLGRTGG